MYLQTPHIHMSCLLIAWLRMKTSTSRKLSWPGGQEISPHQPVSTLAAKLTSPHMERRNTHWARELVRSWETGSSLPCPKWPLWSWLWHLAYTCSWALRPYESLWRKLTPCQTDPSWVSNPYQVPIPFLMTASLEQLTSHKRTRGIRSRKMY